MPDDKLILVMNTDTPKGLSGDEDLREALWEHDIEPVLCNWDDPSMDWFEGRFAVLRSTLNYARHREGSLRWARNVPKLLNSSDILEWNTDKHYLRELAKRGMPIIPTIWLEPDANLTKHQVYTRFPSHGDFMMKPTISSGGCGVGRCTAISAVSRMEVIHHVMDLLFQGSGVTIQRYLSQVKTHGKASVVYFNGAISYTVQKSAMLHAASDGPEPEEIVTVRCSFQEKWGWGEEACRYVHDQIKRITKHDTQVLYNHIDLAPDGKGSYCVVETGLVEGNTYLDFARETVEYFADTIAQRFY